MTSDEFGVQAESLGLRSESISWTATDDGELVVLDLRSSTYMTLNASAVPLWTMLSGGATRAELAQHLVAAHDLERSRAAQDVEAFLDRLHSLDLVVQV